MTSPNSKTGKAVLMLAHVAGMIDLVALPVWVGALMLHYQYSAPQAGITVTLFLLGVVVASLIFAPRFNTLPRRFVAAAGFALGAVCFTIACQQSVDIASFGVLAILHALGGFGAGCGLSFTHGAIGRSANPHRLFAMGGTVLGVFAVGFFAVVPKLVQAGDPTVLFVVFAVLMAVAAAAVLIAFPDVESDKSAEAAKTPASNTLASGPIPKAAWLAIIVVICLTLNQAMVFAFLERIGADRSFSVAQVNGLLIAVGLVNLLPAALAALFQKRLTATTVALMAPIVQTVFAMMIANSPTFMPYAFAASLYVGIVIFTHTFLFGLIAQLDPTGRAVAATPAMMMLGSAIGPALGGGLIAVTGYAGLGWGAAVVAVISMSCMTLVRKGLANAPALSATPASAKA